MLKDAATVSSSASKTVQSLSMDRVASSTEKLTSIMEAKGKAEER